jgi:eight-cysteine-cluster-containing protein
MTMLGVVLSLVACGMEGEQPGAHKPPSVTTADGRWVISEADEHFSRFELPEEEGECEVDAHCAAAGCSAEVCTTVEAGRDLYSPCDEFHPGEQYFCGCIRTRCRWQARDMQADGP